MPDARLAKTRAAYEGGTLTPQPIPDWVQKIDEQIAREVYGRFAQPPHAPAIHIRHAHTQSSEDIE